MHFLVIQATLLLFGGKASASGIVNARTPTGMEIRRIKISFNGDSFL